jgi:hypothetical protein
MRDKVILSVNRDPRFLQAIAEAIVLESMPNYDLSEGEHYADVVDGLVYVDQHRGKPWPPSAAWRIVSVRRLVPEEIRAALAELEGANQEAYAAAIDFLIGHIKDTVKVNRYF